MQSSLYKTVNKLMVVHLMFLTYQMSQVTKTRGFSFQSAFQKIVDLRAFVYREILQRAYLYLCIETHILVFPRMNSTDLMDLPCSTQL